MLELKNQVDQLTLSNHDLEEQLEQMKHER